MQMPRQATTGLTTKRKGDCLKQVCQPLGPAGVARNDMRQGFRKGNLWAGRPPTAKAFDPQNQPYGLLADGQVHRAADIMAMDLVRQMATTRTEGCASASSSENLNPVLEAPDGFYLEATQTKNRRWKHHAPMVAGGALIHSSLRARKVRKSLCINTLAQP
jgi:hypothetical protein